VIKDAAHHLDLRLPVDSDKGTDVEFVRMQEAQMIADWVMDYQGPNLTPKNMTTEIKQEQDLTFIQ
jgi:hypothetical protein